MTLRPNQGASMRLNWKLRRKRKGSRIRPKSAASARSGQAASALADVQHMTKLHKLLWLLAVVFVLAGVTIWRTGVLSKGPRLSPTARDVAQNQCANLAFTSYQKADLALDQQQGTAPLPSIDRQIARRRLQEQFCLQFARCTLPAGTPEASALALETLFSTCLRDEALEEYDATPRK